MLQNTGAHGYTVVHPVHLTVTKFSESSRQLQCLHSLPVVVLAVSTYWITSTVRQSQPPGAFPLLKVLG
jgi:hypothetical protein